MADFQSGIRGWVLGSGTAATNTITVNYTPNLTNSLLFLGVTRNGYNIDPTVQAPTGWTLLDSQSFAAGARVTYLCVKENTSTAATSVTASLTAATGFAAAVCEVTGVVRGPSLASATSNLGRNAQSVAAAEYARTGFLQFSPTWWYPYVIVSACGASASLTAASWQMDADGPNVYTATGAANSTSIAMGVQMCPVAPFALPWGNYQIQWASTTSTSRTTGVVSCMMPPQGPSLSLTGVGT